MSESGCSGGHATVSGNLSADAGGRGHDSTTATSDLQHPDGVDSDVQHVKDKRTELARNSTHANSSLPIQIIS